MMGFIMLAVYCLFIVYITRTLGSTNETREGFLAGGRNQHYLPMAMSIAATWIWAPALFVSAEKAYLNGVPGIFWFLVPNILTLLIFIPFAIRIRAQMPRGYTLSGYMGERYSGRVRKVYVFQLGMLALLSTVVQLLAGGMVMSMILDLPFWATTLFLALFTYYYSKDHGIKASVRTDAVQMVLILAACVIFVPWAIAMNGADALTAGIGGVTGEYTGLFDAKGIEVMLAYGIPAAIGLIAGPFGDQNFWQRVFTVRRGHVKKSFVWAAILFAIVPASMAILGFIAAGSGFAVVNTGYVNFELVATLFPSWAVWVFMFMLLSGLLSTLDSNICAFSSLLTDVLPDPTQKQLKFAMLALVLTGFAIAQINGLSVFHLFLLYGVLRAVTLLTTATTLLGVRLHEAGVFYGILTSLLISLPVFIYGNLENIMAFKLAGSISAPVLAFVIALGVSLVRRTPDTKPVRGNL